MYFAMEHIKPDLHVVNLAAIWFLNILVGLYVWNLKNETLVVHDIFGVMEKDSVETTHPVSTYVEDPRQVQQYFDEISYEKVAAKNHMI